MNALVTLQNEAWMVEVIANSNSNAGRAYDATPAKYHTGASDVADWVFRKYPNVVVVNFPHLGMSYDRDHESSQRADGKFASFVYNRVPHSLPCCRLWSRSTGDERVHRPAKQSNRTLYSTC